MLRTSLPSAVTSSVVDAIDPKILEALRDGSEGAPTVVGPGDALLIRVYRHPEFDSLGANAIAPATSGGGSRTAGLIVENDGTIQFPLLGQLEIAGKTTAEIRKMLMGLLAKYINEPEVTVHVVSPGSLRYYLLGEFAQPGMKLADRPMNLMEALALGGSINLASANLRGAYVARDGKKLPVNLHSLLREGDLRHNIRLRSGDTVFVPDSATDRVFVIGGLQNGVAVPMVGGRLHLTQALVQAGFGYGAEVAGKLDEVRVIRSEGDRGELIVVDAARILRGEASPFYLEAGDVVYVPPTAVTTWNQAIQQILPSLQLVSNLLSPFVQIKFLSGN